MCCLRLMTKRYTFEYSFRLRRNAENRLLGVRVRYVRGDWRDGGHNTLLWLVLGDREIIWEPGCGDISQWCYNHIRGDALQTLAKWST